MRPIHRAIVVAALALVAAPAAFAQGPGGGNFAQRRVQRLLEGITLTSAQQAQVDSIVKAHQAEMPAFTPGQMPDSATRAKARAVMQDEDSAIRAVLTADQQKIFDKNVEMMRMRMRRGPGGR